MPLPWIPPPSFILFLAPPTTPTPDPPPPSLLSSPQYTHFSFSVRRGLRCVAKEFHRIHQCAAGSARSLFNWPFQEGQVSFARSAHDCN